MAERIPSQSPRDAIRLIFSYEGSRVRLLEREHVDMLAPPGEDVPIPKGASGFWVELRDERGRRLYQQAMRQPVRHEVEVFPEDHSALPRYVPRATPEGVFMVLVPDLPEARAAVLFSSPPEPEQSGEPATEILAVHLPARRTGKGNRAR